MANRAQRLVHQGVGTRRSVFGGAELHQHPEPRCRRATTSKRSVFPLENADDHVRPVRATEHDGDHDDEEAEPLRAAWSARFASTTLAYTPFGHRAAPHHAQTPARVALFETSTPFQVTAFASRS